MSRKEAEEKIVSLAGRISSSVSKNIDYLLVGENPGSKFDKAKELGVTVLLEDDFRKLISGG